MEMLVCIAKHYNDENSFLMSYFLVLYSSRQNLDQWGKLKKGILSMIRKFEHKSCLLFFSTPKFYKITQCIFLRPQPALQ